MRPIALLLAALALGACTDGPDEPEMVEDDGGIQFQRNSEFSGPRLRVFLNLQDGSPASVNTDDDAVASAATSTPIPGHQAREWSFRKEEPRGTSLVYAAVSWSGDNPDDYLMGGWWAYFPGQHSPDLDPFEAEEYAIVDGPEIDPAFPPEMPVSGTARYAGLAGGVYAYAPAATLAEAHFVSDGWEGEVTLDADFQAGTVSGCIGCVADLTVRTAISPASRGDVRHDISDYELHLSAQPYKTDGTFEAFDTVEVKHPDRTIALSRGFWGGVFSSRPDADGNPRLAAGFAGSYFEEGDGSRGTFFGSFAGLSETLLNTEAPSQQ